MPAASMPSLPDTDLRKILDNYLNGELIEEQADRLGVHRATVYSALLRRIPEEWRDTQVGHAMAEFVEAKKGLKTAQGPHDLARAREQTRTAQWELERLLKRIYGPSAELTGKDGGPISVEIVRYGSQVIEGAVQHEPPVRSAPLLSPPDGEDK